MAVRAMIAMTLALSGTQTHALSADPAPRPTNEEWKEAKAGVAEEAAAVVAKEDKMSAVNKVIVLLESLKTQVLSEGEEEAQSYNKFACFCKDTTADKTTAIKLGGDKKSELAAFISEEAAARDAHDVAIGTLNDEIKASEQAQKIATGSRKDENTVYNNNSEEAAARDEHDVAIGMLSDEIKAPEQAQKIATGSRKDKNTVYNKNSEDLKAGLEGLRGAIDSVKSSKSPSLAQLHSVKQTVHTALVLADALGLSTEGVPASFLQADPEIAMANYKFHSDGIIATLEKLHADFTTEKTNVDTAEVKAVSLHDKFMQEQTDLVKRKNTALTDEEKGKAAKVASVEGASARRSTTAATLLDDQQYLKELSEICADKAATWDQRSQVRQDELSALTAAIAIVSDAVSSKTTAKTMRLAQRGVSVRMAEKLARDPSWMEAVEAEAEATEADTPLAFFQRPLAGRKAFLAPVGKKSVDADAGRKEVAELLRSSGQKLKSTLLSSLAVQVVADPLAKVKTLIQELIERLLTEAANDSNQKGWCDKATADAEQKRTYAADAVDKHNSDMALLESQRDTLKEELGVLANEIASLEFSQQQAVSMRTEENAENTRTVQDATAGLAATEQAMDILSKFYKTAAKETVKLSIVQTATRASPVEDAPDAGFKDGESYNARQGTAVGIIGMLEVISSDFTRTISETEKAEEQARQDHLKFMTETGKSLKVKGVAQDEKTKQKGEVEENLADADTNLQAQMEILSTGVKELMELKPVCVDTGMSYDERVARRKDEIDAMKKGLCILENYAQYGPGGLAGTAQGAC